MEKQYLRPQKLFIDYAKAHTFNPFVAQPVHLVNYLLPRRHLQSKWPLNTCLHQCQTAILNLLSASDWQECFHYSAFVEFYKALADSPLLSKDFSIIDLSPAIARLHAMGPNLDMPLLSLTQKLGFLLGLYGPVRASDVERINDDYTKLLAAAEAGKQSSLKLVILAASKKRQGRPIGKAVIIQPHTVDNRCPVSCYLAYKQRVAATSIDLRCHPTFHISGQCSSLVA